MLKLVALYSTPDDPAAFMEHYESVHTPLVKAIPGVKKVVVSKVTQCVVPGPVPFFLVSELHFESESEFERAMKSDENRAAGKDLMSFAKGKVTLLVTRSID